ncbi:unnamed protein product [Caenorhabditis angaria]|uniref:Uncharacterized protein n=1 Tax=Caenorhabditis angaria TaxID=860376 RepID=A0A9P1I7I8_9PELO|nr:unnamed protein product [Caenorhabditis angaria]
MSKDYENLDDVQFLPTPQQKSQVSQNPPTSVTSQVSRQIQPDQESDDNDEKGKNKARNRRFFGSACCFIISAICLLLAVSVALGAGTFFLLQSFQQPEDVQKYGHLHDDHHKNV